MFEGIVEESVIYISYSLHVNFFHSWLLNDSISKLPISVFLSALSLCSRTLKQETGGVNMVEMDDDEVECLLANMIDKGYVRGYLSHEKFLVLKNGFLAMSF